MKKSFSIRMITCMALAACLSFAIGLALVTGSQAIVKADAEYTTPTTFEMLGMSMRYSAADGDDGIRFGVKLDKTTYEELIADGNAVAGILVAPTDQLASSNIDGKPLNLWNAVSSKAAYGVLYSGGSGKNYWKVEGDYAIGIVYLHGFPTASYNRPITAVGYIDWDNGSSAAEMKYSDTVEVSMADVALTVLSDYEGSNAYGTTEDQAAKLDDYLLSYTVRFLDAYNTVVKTESVKFGEELTVSDYVPTERTGYTYNGWHEKTGSSSYASAATNFNASGAKVVKRARTFKAGFDAAGSTYEKPALSTSNPKYIADGANFSKAVTDGELALRGGYYMDGITVANGDDFMVSMTFEAVDGYEYVFMITDDLASGRGRITFKNNKFNFYNYTSGTYDDKSWAWYDSIESRSNKAGALTTGTEYTMSLVHKNGKYIVYIDDYEAVEFAETESLQSSSSYTVADLVGDGSTLYLGIGSISHETSVTDWRSTTDSSTINDFMIMETIGNSAPTSLHITESEAKIGNSSGVTTAYINGVSIPQNTDFVIYATAKSGHAPHIGFTVGTLASASNHLLFRWRANNIYVTRESPSWTGHDDNRWTPGHGGNSSDKDIALVYKNGVYYMIMNGEQVWSADDNGVPNGWNGTLGISSNIGTSGDKRIGFMSYQGTTTYSGWGYSTDAAIINGYLKLERRGNYDPTILRTSGTEATIKAESNQVVTTYIEGAEVAQNTDFVIYATAKSGFAGHIGFVVGTLADTQKHMLFSWREGDIYVWRQDGWKGHADNAYRPGYGSNSSAKDIALVYKSGRYYMIMNGKVVFDKSETADIGWSTVLNAQIGTSGTKKLGLYTYAGTTTYANYGYSTNASVIADYLKGYQPALTTSNPKYSTSGENKQKTISSGTLTLEGAYYMENAVVANGADFLVQMKFTAVSGTEYVFLITDDIQSGQGRITLRNDNKFCIYNYTSGTYNGVKWDWYDCIEERANSASALTAGTEYTMTLIHKGGKYYVFINGTKAVEFAETEELTMWGGKSNPVKHVTDIVGSGSNVYLGIGSVKKATTITDWWFTTNAKAISAFVA